MPCRYRAPRKSWMSSELFEEWTQEFNWKFGSVKRKIAFIIDNCTAHPHVENLEWIELIFLPSNTTSHTQSMYQGVIRALKAKCRSRAVCKLITALEWKEPIPRTRVLLAYVLTCQRVLCAYVFKYQGTLRAYVPACLACLSAHVL